MGLSADQIKLVQSSFGTITGDLESHGAHVLAEWFRRNPGIQGMFPALKSIPAASLESDQKVRDHARKILTEMKGHINNLGTGAFNSGMVQNAKDHKGRGGGGITVDHYRKLFAVVADVLGKDAATKAAWQAFAGECEGILGQNL